MRTFRKTLVLFVVFLMATYFFPLFFDWDKKEPILLPEVTSSNEESESSTLPQSSADQSLIPAVGFANYVGLAVDDFLVEYGEPVNVETLSDMSEIWIYGTDSTDYLQVIVENYVVTEVLVLGTSVEIPPFEMGMEQEGMYPLASFHPKFIVPFENQSIQINLNENELNNRPLIAFDNQTYAVITMDSQTNTVIGIQYMTNEKLLSSGLYDLAPFSSVVQEPVKQLNPAALEKVRTQQTIRYINIMREKMGLIRLEESLILEAVGNDLFEFHQSSKEQDLQTETESHEESSEDALIISDEAAVEEVNESEADESNNQETRTEDTIEAFEALNETTIQSFLEQESIDLDKVRLLYQIAPTDPSVYALQWFTLAEYRDILMDDSMRRIGITYQGDELLVILDDGFEISL